MQISHATMCIKVITRISTADHQAINYQLCTPRRNCHQAAMGTHGAYLDGLINEIDDILAAQQAYAELRSADEAAAEAASEDAVGPDTNRPQSTAAPAAALPTDGLALDKPTGPREEGSSRNGKARRQYCWWITFAYPFPDTVLRLGLKTPDDFTRQTLLEAMQTAYAKAKCTLHEAAVFMELHKRTDEGGRRLPHLNVLTRSAYQHGWSSIAAALFKDHKIRVDFSANIRTWFDGVVYGSVSSDHKPELELDCAPLRWSLSGEITPFDEVLPGKWRKQGRQPKLSKLQFLDIVRKQKLTTETEVAAFAAAEEQDCRRALVAFLMENENLETLLRKAALFSSAAASVARAKLTRVQLLRQSARPETCSCSSPGLWLSLALQVLDRNNLNGVFQRAVFKAMDEGRQKMNNVFLLGPSNCGKSFLFKPLKLLFSTYQQPDGGSYQLETLLGKEIIFLNDFEWDATEKWCRWAFFKNFLEGGSLAVGRPKNRGGDAVFEASSPVFGTCYSPVIMFNRRGSALSVNTSETEQMNNRIVYLRLSFQMPEHAIRYDVPDCCCCAAQLYLAGALTGATSNRQDRSRSPRRI